MGLRASVNTDKSLIRCRVILDIVLWVFLVRWRHGSPLLWLWSPVAYDQPCTGARTATSYQTLTTATLLEYKSQRGARSTGRMGVLPAR